MRIITWNVRFKNPRARFLIDHALSHTPDIMCFQEFPESMIPYLKQRGFTVTEAHDFVSRVGGLNSCIVIASKKKPISTHTINYSHIKNASLLSRWVYTRMAKMTEQHLAPVSVISHGGGTVQITNARLSCAVGTRERLKEFETILAQLKPTIPTILAGDFNIVDNPFFNLITGWVRGFHVPEYFINERKAFERMVAHHGYTNIFRKRSTSITNHPLLQFDHILIPKDAHVTYHIIEKKRFGSDHRMLLADIEMPKVHRSFHHAL